MTSTGRAARLAALAPDARAAFLDALPADALRAMPWIWEVWARPQQLAPAGDWRSWLILGGRGSGKTRAGAEWVRAQAEGATPLTKGQCRRLALIGETADQARDVMVLGESGLMAATPPDRRPVFHVSRRRLVWRNGAEAHLFSASDPESLRGPQFDAAWCDELAKWRQSQEAWDMLQFALRLGQRPRQVISTTPRGSKTLMALLDDPGTAVTRMPTRDNAANLAPGFLARMEAEYAGRRLGRQELLGELVLDVPGALWSRALIEDNRVSAVPHLDRVVIAVDPPVTAGHRSDACGIIAAGVTRESGAATVLRDWSVERASPRAWAARAITAYHAHKADRIVAEVNQGGDMVETILRQIDPEIPFRAVRATRGKTLRAEPVAALYEQGRVKHLTSSGDGLERSGASLAALEDEMCAFGPDGRSEGGKSPDRVDALVWAITDLLLNRVGDPSFRTL